MTLLQQLEAAGEGTSGKVELWGEVGAARFNEALNAVHAFAQATACRPGGDVFDWIGRAHLDLVTLEIAKNEALRARSAGESE